ncbi:phosphate-starvation-inducible PsiE family protein [Thiohalocapsa halophila]|jgi:uncharacterized membrane protein (DUF373 family)
MPSIDALPWWDWPDFARVALVLATVAAAGLLGTLLVRAARRSSGPPVRPPGRRPRLPAGMHAPQEGQSMSGGPAEHEEFPTRAPDPVLRTMHRVLRVATYVLAIAMVVVILEGVASVIHTLYVNMSSPPYFMVPDIVKMFGVFLAVLIAYEIFANITLYLRTDVFPVKLVVATAVMAIARKVIILDMEEYSALDLVGIGAVVLALGIAYWLISQADAGGKMRWSTDGEP